MQLLYSPMSPFARKVRVVAHEAGLAERVEISVVRPFEDEGVREVNPLAKVPCMLTDDGQPLHDSRVICEYLDALAGANLFPAGGEARWRALTIQSLADGMGDAAVRTAQERRRAEDDQHADVIDRQLKAIDAALDTFERGGLPADSFLIGEIAVAAQLGYLDFRKVVDWREGRLGLSDWYEAVSKRDSMVATEPWQVA
ncbi:MAG TPA: glutathione S-transferase N-terminal domain-containing protein [Caulobacteraceae bacterium]|nr:glutathione S-transferase N-terminal domain-containing protein [Caulobacteraceae bacterium]